MEKGNSTLLIISRLAYLRKFYVHALSLLIFEHLYVIKRLDYDQKYSFYAISNRRTDHYIYVKYKGFNELSLPFKNV